MCDASLCIVVFFFFFKQKTAYEMRISDWSSDVCSSDLSPVEAPMRPILPLLLLAALPAFAADPVPEITRPAATPQANGVVHTLRQIPEACARIEGAFT